MQMFLFNRKNGTGGIRQDGDFDPSVIYHENTHGLSIRLVGGGSGGCLGGLQAGGMGEGWGDFMGASFLNNPVGGAYVTGNATTGIRRQSMANSTFTYNDIKNGTLAEVHDAGELWAAAASSSRLGGTRRTRRGDNAGSVSVARRAVPHSHERRLAMAQLGAIESSRSTWRRENTCGMYDTERLFRSIPHRIDALRVSAILKGISPASLSALASHATPVRLRVGSILWHESEPSARLAYVVRGRLVSQKSSVSGKVVYYDISKAGEMIGYSCLVAWSGRAGAEPIAPTHHATVVAREEAIVLTVDSSIVHRIMADEPILVRRILWELCKRSFALADEIFDERTKTGTLVLASKLLRMAAMEGKSTGRAHLDYSQEELMGFTGLSSRNINKFLGELPGVRTSNGRRGVQIESIETLRGFVRAAEQ